MAVTFALFIVNIYIASCRTTASALTTPVSLGYKPTRPSYAGATGGNWVGNSEQRVPPGKPWPAKPANYSQSNVSATAITLKEELFTPSAFSATNSSSFDSSGSQSVPPVEPEYSRPDNNESFNSTLQKPLESEANQTPSSVTDQSTYSSEDETLTSSKLPESNRPPFLGHTGGNFIPERVPPEKLLPARPEDEGFGATSHKSTLKPQIEVITSAKPPKPNRPPFLGPTGGNYIPERVPPGKPLPAKPEDYESFNVTSQTPITQTTISSSVVDQDILKPENEVVTVPKLPVPNRPPFLGPTGGNYIPERVPPGKPWPARPEDYEGFSVTSQKPTLKPQNEVITSPKPPIPNRPPFLGPTGGNFIPERVPPGKPLPARPEDEDFNVTPQKPTLNPQIEVITSSKPPVPNRPPFLGPTGGNYIPERVPPGKPWPARPEDYEGFSVTSQKPTLKPQNEVITSPKPPIPNRPPFLGPTGGNFIPERVPPGKPLPARPEDEDFNVTPQKPTLNPQIEVITSSKPPVPNRPPFLGPTGGNYIPERVPPGKPWPARPEDYEGFSVTSQKPTLKPQNEVITSPKPPVPNRPPFLGPTGGNFIPERVPPGKPLPARPQEYETSSLASQKPTGASNRPSFLGPTGGNFILERVPPGKPWPASPEDYEGFSVTSQKPISQSTGLSTTSSEADQGTLKPEIEVVTPPKLPISNRPPFLGPTGGNYIPERVPPGKPLPTSPEGTESSSVASLKPTPAPNRPSFLGPTGGNFIPEKVPPGKPWPARPEDYESFSVTSQKPVSQTPELSTTPPETDQGALESAVTPPKLPVPNRPPFLGPTGGNFIPERVPPGKPLPAKPESPESLIITSQTPLSQIAELSTISSVVDQGTSKPENEVITSSKPPVPNRPPFLGATGGNFIPERIPPGTSLPAKPEDYNITSERPVLQEELNETTIVSSVSDSGTLKPQNEIITSPKPALPNRPSFLGPTGGNFIPESVSPGKPLPDKSQDYEGFNTTPPKPSIGETSSTNICYLNPQNVPNTSPKVPITDGSPFVGSTEGDKKPENHEGSNVSSQESYTEDVQDTNIKFPEDRKSISNIDNAYFYLGSGETTKLKLSTQQEVADVETAKKPSLSISFNIDALKTIGESSTLRGGVLSKESTSIGDTKQFLTAEKASNIGQNKKFLTVSIKFGDFISSAKNLSAARFSVAQILNTRSASDIASGETEPQVLSENQSYVKLEKDHFNEVLKKPLLSVFVNLKDFRKTNKDSSHNDKK